MVIDTSALMAILQDEPERRALNEAIEAADSRAMSVATFVEVSIVIESRYGTDGLRDLDLFLDRAGIELASVDVEQGKVARDAFSRFGKGRHPAGLNLGDCFAYALAPLPGGRLLADGRHHVRSAFFRLSLPPDAPIPARGPGRTDGRLRRGSPRDRAAGT